MATKAALEAMALNEEKRHNKQVEEVARNKFIADTVIGGVHEFGNLVKTAGGLIAAIGAAGDPADFKHNNEAILNATQHAYANKKGQPIILSGQLTLIDSGILVADYLPTIGTLKGAAYNTPVQSMFQEIFQVIRGKNSGSVNYDYVDLGQVIIALDSMRIVFEEITRALDLSQIAETMNSYTIRAIVKALGYDVEFLNTNRLAIISILNKFASDMAKVSLPGNLPYFRRHANLSGHILTDRIEGDHRNFYAYRCKGYYTYDEINAKLVFHQVIAGGNTDYRNDLVKLTTLLNTFVVSFQRSDAVTIMSGDVEKAVSNGAISAEALFYFPVIKLENSLELYHKELFWCNELDLSSFRNMTIFKYTVDTNYDISQQYNASTGSNFIYQGTLDASNVPNGVLVGNPAATGSLYPTTGDGIPSPFVRTDHDKPDDDSVIEDTRFISYYLGGPTQTFITGSTPIPIGSHGSEIIVRLQVSVYTSESAWRNDNPSNYVFESTFHKLQVPNVLVDLIRVVGNIPYMPMLFVDTTDSNTTPLIIAPYYNGSKYSVAEIENINDLALRSLFYFDPSQKALSTETISGGNSEGKKDKKKSSKKWNKKKSRKGGKPKDNSSPKEDEPKK